MNLGDRNLGINPHYSKDLGSSTVNGSILDPGVLLIFQSGFIVVGVVFFSPIFAK
jgi:hypothetical protein